MRTKMKDNLKRIAVLFALVILCITTIWGGQNTAPLAYADSTLNFDSTDILEDLKGTTIDGKEFNISDYPKSPFGKTKVLTFVEYCYSMAENNNGNYALYVYVYNPTLSDISTAVGMNAIELASGFEGKGNVSEYSTFKLKYCSSHENVFLKFRVIDNDRVILNMIQDYEKLYGDRPYFVSGVELITLGAEQPTEIAVDRKFTYSGYAKGYGDSEKFPLTLTVDYLETVTVQPKSTYYRYPATSSTSTQVDTVYFSLEPKYIEQWGEMYSIQAQYYNYLTAPIIVTHNYEFYSYMADWVGVDIGKDGTTENKYAMYIPVLNVSVPFFKSSWFYNHAAKPWNVTATDNAEYMEKLVYLFYSGDNTKVSDYTLPSEELIASWESYTAKHGAGNVYKGYNDDLFVSGDFGKPTPIDITVDELFDLKVTGTIGGDTVGDLLWYWLTGGKQPDDRTNIEPIYTVKPEDIADKNLISDKLLIAKDDVNDFLKYYKAETAKGNEVVLFRFAQSEYRAQDITIDASGVEAWDQSSTELRQEYVYLGFNFLSFTFQDEYGKQSVIAVVSDPIDIVSDSEPSTEKNFWEFLKNLFGGDSVAWWAYVILVIGELLILWLLRLILCNLCALPKWVWWIVFAVAIILNIFFFKTWARQIYILLKPYLGWLPFS